MNRLSLLMIAIWAIALLTTAFGCAQSASITLPTTGTVLSVGDGDTFRVRSGHSMLTLRLACIDAAELAQKPTGLAAASRLKQLLPVGQPVTFKIADTDRYGRSVAKVFREGFPINVVMVQEGQAVVYRDYLHGCPDLKEQLLNAEASAKSRRLGIWGQPNFVMPWDFRKAQRSQPTPALAPISSAPAARDLPTCAYGGDCDCSDFSSQAQAQRVLDLTPTGDPHWLDGDSDRVACERLP